MNKNWFKNLNAEEYRVMRESGTEAPFSSELNAFFDDGKYLCKGCGTVLFSSESKFDGHCGWPSFDLEIEEGIIEKKRDLSHGMIRTEIVCAQCKSHLGHLFDDGPTDTGLRYCVNGISLVFQGENSENEWFENWFDSPYYPLLYQKRNMEEAEKFITNLLHYLKPNPSSKILDLACGEGRHSIFLAKKGFDVTGIDLSERSIQIAKRNNINDVQFSIADMRTFSLETTFDYIFNLFTSFGYFQRTEDNLEVLKRINHHLQDSGRLVIDFLNKNLVTKNLVEKENKVVDGISFDITREIKDAKVVKTIAFEADGEKKIFQEKVQLFSLQDFEKMLASVKFEIVQTFGNYDLQPFDAENSPRLIIIAKKKINGLR